MKKSIILFAIFMICSSIVPQLKNNKCNCGVETRLFYKGKLVKIISVEKGFRQTNHQKIMYVESERILCDSIYILPQRR